MGRVALLGFVVGVTGCAFVVPKTTSTPVVAAEETRDIVPDKHGPLGVELRADDRAVIVRVAAPRVCTRETWHHREITHERGADLEVVDTYMGAGSGGEIVLALFTPIALVISGAVTGIVLVASDNEWRTRDTKKAITRTYQCPVTAPHVPIAVTLPSGATLELTTDAHGNATFVVPDTEPANGNVLVHAGSFPQRAVRYGKTMNPVELKADERTACLQTRSQRMRLAQTVTDLKERTRRLQSLPVCPPATR